MMNCNIARDLLVLYFDGVCSGETRKELEEHLQHCEACRQLKEELEAERKTAEEKTDWEGTITPLKKVRKKIYRKNVVIGVCVFLLLVLAGGTSLLTYGQLAKKGVSFEMLYDAVRFRYIGRQFAQGNIEPLYEVLSNGYVLKDEESGVIRLAYADKETYDADMKAAFSEKYRKYFDGVSLKFAGIEEIGYSQTPKTEQNRTLYILLKFEGEAEYYIGLYKVLDGQYLAEDYFGNPYMTYSAFESDVEDTPSLKAAETYHTDDSLFSGLPNALSDVDLSMMRYTLMVSGRRAVNGDTVLVENGQLPANIMSERDLAEGTYSLRQKANDKLELLTKEGYYAADITWSVTEYDKARHLYRYRVDLTLTDKTGADITVSTDCYRIADNFVCIPQTTKLYGDGLTEEMAGILGTLYE
ncbi:MAG: zf-HC2 domain-containing protein [Alistipes sp.]|nr:zf-HC2 domain-containing protein [Alistipes sp.]